MLRVYARFPVALGTGSGSGESGQGSDWKEEVCEQRGCRSCRQCASRSIRLRCSVYIGELLVYVSQTTSLLLCLLAESRLKLDRLFFRYRSKKFGISDVLRIVRNGFLQFVVPRPRRVESRRIAVGLKPLESTSNDW